MMLHKILSETFIINNRFLENLIGVTSEMSGTHSKSTMASAASQAEPVENPSNLENFEREDTVIEGLLTGLFKVIKTHIFPS